MPFCSGGRLPRGVASTFSMRDHAMSGTVIKKTSHSTKNAHR